jgi:hypothetical protein
MTLVPDNDRGFLICLMLSTTVRIGRYRSQSLDDFTMMRRGRAKDRVVGERHVN